MSTARAGSASRTHVTHSHRRAALILAALLVVVPTVAAAGPLVLEEVAKISAPDSTFAWPLSVAVDGDWIIATGAKSATFQGIPDSGTEYGAWLYRRQSNGSWSLVRRLVQAVGPEDFFGPQSIVDAHAGVAAVVTMTSGTFVFERTGETWNAAPNTIETNGFDVAVDAGTIVVTTGFCSWQANAYRKAADGVWRLVRQTAPDPEPSIECENEFDFDSADVSGSSIIVLSVNEASQSSRIFEGAFGGPATVTRLFGPDGRSTGRPIAIDNTAAFAGVAGTVHSYLRDASGWRLVGPMQRPDELTVGSGEDLEVRGFAARGAPNDAARGLNSGSVGVFQRMADGSYRYVAKLLAKDGAADRLLGTKTSVSGRRIAATSVASKALYVFELPTSLTQPTTLQDNFEDGNASTWSFLAGSNFSVVSASGSRVLRQTSVVGDAAAFLNDTQWRNQAIEADIRPRAYASGTGARWFGLVTRYTPGNYYYVTLRNSNEIQLKKFTNGAISLLTSAALPVSLNRTYRVRLEAIGTRIRTFVDDRLLAEVTDTTHKQGQAGIFMYKTAADYDNIVVSPNPYTTLVRYTFNDGPDPDSVAAWEQLGTWQFTRESNGNGVFAQSSTTGDARAIGGIATDDQIVQSRIRRTATAGTQNWFGLATRYTDARNYYYVTLRNTNVISLRKLVNGTIFELDSAPLTVASNTWYAVRFSAVGDQLRVYVNGQLLVEATDATHRTGRYGPVMYKNAALYDDVLAVQP